VSLLELEKMYHDIGRDVFGSQSAVRRLLKGNAADNTAIRNLLLEYLGDLPMLDAPDQLVRCFVVSTQQTERLEVRLLKYVFCFPANPKTVCPYSCQKGLLPLP